MNYKLTILIITVVAFGIIIAVIMFEKKEISLDNIKIVNLEIKDDNISLVLSSGSSYKNNWQYNYVVQGEKLYIEVFDVSMLNPFSIKNEIFFNISKGANDIKAIYIESGKNTKLIWQVE